MAVRAMGLISPKVMVPPPCLLLLSTSLPESCLHPPTPTTEHSRTTTLLTERAHWQLSSGSPQAQLDTKMGWTMGTGWDRVTLLFLASTHCQLLWTPDRDQDAHGCPSLLVWSPLLGSRENRARLASELYDLAVLDRSCRPYTGTMEGSDS